MGRGGAFGGCSRNQLALIFLNTCAFFVAGTLLGYDIYVFSYMRTTNPALVGISIAVAVCVMIATGMGAWGALLKKHGVIKAYFYFVLMVDILLVVICTVCYITANDVGDYVDYQYRKVLSAMPDSTCGTPQSETIAYISGCKNSMKDTLQENLRTMGACCVAMACVMLLGLIASGRLLTWERLTAPLLNGGGVVMVCFAAFCIAVAARMTTEEADKLTKDAWAGYISAAGAAFVLLLGILGISGVRNKSVGVLLAHQILALLTIVLLIVVAAVSFVQYNDIESYAKDNFDKGTNIRNSLNINYCDNDDYAHDCSSVTCGDKNSTGAYKYYTCDLTSNQTCILNAGSATAIKCCLSTNVCIDKATDVLQADLVAMGTTAVFYVIYVFIVLRASRNIRAKFVDELAGPTLGVNIDMGVKGA